MTSGISYFSDIRNSYSTYAEKNFWYLKKTILHIRNSEQFFFKYLKRISDIQNNYFRYPKTLFWISEIKAFSEYQDFLFWISEISISDIRNKVVVVNYFRYPKYLFRISRVTISDTWKNWINVNSACHSPKQNYSRR